MNFEVGYRCGEWSLTSDSIVLLKELMEDVEALIKSTAYAGNYEATKEYIDTLLKLRKAKKEMEEAKNDTL